MIGWKDLLVLMSGGTGGDCISRSKRLVRIVPNIVNIV